MGEYLFGIITTSVLLSIVSFLSYSEKNTALKLSLSVLLLYTVVSPIVSGQISTSFEDIFSYVENTDIDVDGEGYKEAVKDAFEEGVRRALCNEFSLSAEEVSVTAVGFNFEDMSAERITVTLTGNAAFANHRGIKDYLFENGKYDCEVNVYF